MIRSMAEINKRVKRMDLLLRRKNEASLNEKVEAHKISTLLYQRSEDLNETWLTIMRIRSKISQENSIGSSIDRILSDIYILNPTYPYKVSLEPRSLSSARESTSGTVVHRKVR